MRARQQQGLTLIEVLVAMTIFALIGLAGYSLLSATIQGKERSEETQQKWRYFNKALWLLRQDLEQIVDRPVRNELGQGGALLVNKDGFLLQLSRAGFNQPQTTPHSRLLRVAYRMDFHPESNWPDSPFFGDEQRYLLRYVYQDMDVQEERQARPQVLIGGIDSVSVSVLDGDKAHEEWPSVDAQSGALRDLDAVNILIEHPDTGVLNILVAL